MIRAEDVADLREGDVVEIRDARWPEGSVLRGPLAEIPNGHSRGALTVCGVVVRWSDGAPALPVQDLTVVSRAPRPLYVNHPRTEPVPGDVVRQENGSSPSGHTWHYIGDEERGARWWRFDDTRIGFGKGRLRLLVDGTTGQVVP